MIVSACLLVGLTLSGSAISFGGVQDEVKHTKDSFEKIKENVKAKKAIIVDVREKNEWDAGHLKGAKLVPWSKIRFASTKKKMKELPNDEVIIYCHCRAGRRALNAAKKLSSMGYDVRPIKAGFDELVENGFEKAKKDKSKDKPKDKSKESSK